MLMREHVRILGIIHIVLGALGLLAALVLLTIFGLGGAAAGAAAAHSNDPDAMVALPIIGAIGVGIFLLIAVLTIPGLIAGVGLLKLRPWARILTIVLSAMNLLSVPIGTALGVYGLWVLLNKDTEALFRGITPVAPSAPFQP
jgi:hypothetical protein